MRIRSLFSSAIFLVLCAFAPSAEADNAGPRFCVVPVQGATAGIGAMGAVYQQTFAAYRLPGVPAPVFAPVFGRAWTIDANRRGRPLYRT
jgi:hypothetical protein